jgi:hypothetical protein
LAIFLSRMTRWCESTPRTASWNPQPIASSGTLKSWKVFTSPVWMRSIAFSRNQTASAAEYAMK